MIDISPDKIVIGCDICGKIVYQANHVSSIKGIADYYPLTNLQQTYKVYCEKCYMEPLEIIKELQNKIGVLNRRLGIREKRAKKMIDKYKDSLE